MDLQNRKDLDYEFWCHLRVVCVRLMAWMRSAYPDIVGQAEQVDSDQQCQKCYYYVSGSCEYRYFEGWENPPCM